jgi:hypothetical protein
MSSLEHRYLAIIKKALIFGLWDEPGLPITAQNDSRPFFKRRAVDVVSKAFDRVGLELAFRAGRADSDRRIGRFWPRYPQDVGDRHHEREYLSVSREEVEENFRRYGLLSDQIVFLEGWFSETLPAAPVDQLAVLRVDGDMYSSTTDVLVSMYPKLAPGGFCVIDDYALPGCRQATDDFRNVNRISSELIKIDWTGVFWRKAKNP